MSCVDFVTVAFVLLSGLWPTSVYKEVKSFFFLIYLIYYYYFRLCWVFIAAHGLSLVAASGGYSSLQARAPGTQASVVVARGLSSCGSQALESRLSSCGARAYLLCSMWNLPGPGIEPVSPALAGGFLTTVPSGKSP